MGAVQDVYDFIEAEGFAAGSTEWDLRRRRLMDELTKDQLVVVTEDGGPSPEIPDDSGIGDSAFQDIGVLVTVRAKAWDGDSGLNKASDIFDAMHGKHDLVVGSTTYLRVRAQTPEPVFVGFDDKGRPRHTVALLLLTPILATSG